MAKTANYFMRIMQILPLSLFAAVLFLAAFLLFFGAANPAEAAFGISPPFLNAGHLVPGAKYIQAIYLVQDQPNEDLPMVANLDLKEPARSWMSIDRGFNFVIPKGTRQFPIQVTIDVPKNAGLGIFSGTLSFTGAPSEKGQVTIALGAQVAINLTIGTDIYESFSVPLIKLLDIEEGWSPRVYVKFRNDGNVPEAFDNAFYELFDQYGGTRLAYTQVRKDLPETQPFTIKEYYVEFPLNFYLGIGQYWGNVAFYQKDKLIASQKAIFNVLKSGSIAGPVARTLNYLRGQWVYYVAALAVAGGAISIYLRRRRRFRK